MTRQDNNKPITASELATFAFCERAWYHRYVEKRRPATTTRERLEAGRAGHAAHANEVFASRRALLVAVMVLLLALVAIALTWTWIGG